jgi:lysophospholipase L1-like esterase
VARTFLALGDSYTIGDGVDAADRWPIQLAGLLRGAGTDIADPFIVAQTGWTTDELADAIDAAKLTGSWDLVSLAIGVNNQYRGRPVEEYRAGFRDLLATAIRFAGRKASRVIVLSIPDWGVMPYGEGADRPRVAGEIDAYNAAAKSETERTGAAWIDVTPTSRAMKDDGAAPDGLHPSGRQYAAWAALALAPARAALASK